MRKTECEDEEDRDIDDHESPKAVGWCCVTHGGDGKEMKMISLGIHRFHGRHALHVHHVQRYEGADMQREASMASTHTSAPSAL